MQAAEYEERAPLMFKLDAEGPTASGRPAVTRTVTKENVQSAWRAANGYCEEHGAALSEAYGNFDRVVALGWLLGDVAIGCLIKKADAFKVGRKAGKLAPGLKTEFDAPARRLGKRKHAFQTMTGQQQQTRRLAYARWRSTFPSRCGLRVPAQLRILRQLLQLRCPRPRPHQPGLLSRNASV